MNSLLIILCALFMCSCGQQNDTTAQSHLAWQQIAGRDEGAPVQRHPIYRAKVPAGWNRQDPDATQSIADTMKALCEFSLGSEAELIRITLHNFPSRNMQERIAPAAQIARWKQQFDSLALTDVIVSPLSRGGFTGLYFEGSGIMHGVPATVIGWSMQMAPEQYQHLEDHSIIDRQRRSDYTIKVIGTPEQINQHRHELTAFAASFELIEEIPLP